MITVTSLTRAHIGMLRAIDRNPHHAIPAMMRKTLARLGLIEPCEARKAPRHGPKREPFRARSHRLTEIARAVLESVSAPQAIA